MEQNNTITGTNFVITSSKLHVPVVTLSINNDMKCLENRKQGFKRTMSQKKYRNNTRTKKQ